MQKLSKLTLALVLTSFLYFYQPVLTLGQEGWVDLDLRDKTLSANIREAPLESVIREMKKETGIRFHKWLKSSEFLFSEEVSVRFRSLPVEEGGRLTLNEVRRL